MPSSLRFTRYVILRIFINLIHLRSPQFNIQRTQPLRPLYDLPNHKDDWEHSTHGVREDKCREIPLPTLNVNKSSIDPLLKIGPLKRK
jgi:hypothetical protein